MSIHTIHPDLLSGLVNIVLVGAGGNGSQMLNGLARLHVAMLARQHPGGLHVRVYDPDRVSEANVGRQLFSPSDIGQYKACVLVHRLNCFFGLDWEARPGRFTLAQGMNTPDILVSCVDTAASRKEIESLLRKRHTQTPHYWLDLGNRRQDGQVVLGHLLSENQTRRIAIGKATMEGYLPNVMDIYPELRKRTKEDTAPSCSLAESLERQDLFINDHVSRWALHLLWALFRQGCIEHHGYLVNLMDGAVNPLPVPSPDSKGAKNGSS